MSQRGKDREMGLGSCIDSTQKPVKRFCESAESSARMKCARGGDSVVEGLDVDGIEPWYHDK